MKVKDLDPTLESRQQFHRRSESRVPANAGCYVVAAMDDDVLYIGMTGNLRRRFGEHLDDPEKTAATSLGLPRWFYYKEMVPNLTERYERRLLGRHQQIDGNLPPLNRSGP